MLGALFPLPSINPTGLLVIFPVAETIKELFFLKKKEENVEGRAAVLNSLPTPFPPTPKRGKKSFHLSFVEMVSVETGDEEDEEEEKGSFKNSSLPLPPFSILQTFFFR